MIKLTYYPSMTKHQSDDLIGKIYFTACAMVKEGKEFTAKLENEKTPKQLRGFYRICEKLAPYFEEGEGSFCDKDMVKEFVKKECNYCAIIKGQSITKSLKKATRKEMQAMIVRLYEICEFHEVKDYKLRPEEQQSLVEYFNKQDK